MAGHRVRHVAAFAFGVRTTSALLGVILLAPLVSRLRGRVV